jgi:SAM-dependent methyltransferase
MERSQWSRAAHGDLEFMGPYDADSFAELFDAVELPSRARVLDLGCGNGALLRWLAGRGPIEGVGVDLQPGSRRIDGVRLVQGDARAFPAEPAAYDLVCSVGAVTAIDDLARLARPGGLVLLGDGYWKREPSAAYLTALGAARDEFASWHEVVRMGDAHGLSLLRARPSTVEEWDRYETAWAANGERYAADHAGEPGLDAFAEWIGTGRRRYLELGGRDTLGFALLLFRQPTDAAHRSASRRRAAGSAGR